MQLSRVKIFIVSSLFLFASAWAAAADVSIPGGRMAISSKSPLKPLLNNHGGIKSEEQRESVLRGLLQTRQYVCPSGYGQCKLGVCCLLNGGCCPNNTCCGPHQRCCDVGCCDLSDYCAIDSSTGRRGCCPLGETCSGSSNTCDDAGYFPCPNDDYCCPFGNTCFRDSNGSARCGASGSNPTPTTRRTTTFRATSTKSSFTTRAASTKASSVEESVLATKTTTDLSPTAYSTPLPPPGVQNVVVSVTDSRILWVGTSWTLGSSSCNSTAQSKKISDTGSLSFEATPGASVYLALSPYNAEYEVKVNERSTTFRKTSIPGDCLLLWSSDVLTTKSDIIVTVLGPASASDGRRQLSDDWSFEFHHFLMTVPEFMNSTGFIKPSGLVEPSGLTPPSNAAAYAKARLMLDAGLIITLVVFLGFF